MQLFLPSLSKDFPFPLLFPTFSWLTSPQGWGQLPSQLCQRNSLWGSPANPALKWRGWVSPFLKQLHFCPGSQAGLLQRELHWHWWEATAASWGRQWAWDFVDQLYPQSFILCLDSTQPRRKPHQEMHVRPSLGSPLATTILDKELLSHNNVRACSGSDHRTRSAPEVSSSKCWGNILKIKLACMIFPHYTVIASKYFHLSGILKEIEFQCV